MSHIIIDRRKNDKDKSIVNRRRFVKKVKQQVRDAVKKQIGEGSVEDIIDSKRKKIRIPGKGLSQPTFHHSKKGGVTDTVHPGNKEFNAGDRIPRPPEGGGAGGRKGSPDGEGEDAFDFHLTKDEFMDIFFEDLELPDMVKKTITQTEEFVNKRAGFSVDGNPSRLNIERSMRQAKGRKIGLGSKKKRRKKELEAELEMLQNAATPISNDADAEQEWRNKRDARINEIELELIVLRRKLKAIPFIDDVDLRYNRWERVPQPTTQAVMFGIMDVSGSMGEWEKEMAKRFFMLLLLFLTRQYERVDVVWIRHHSIAKEVDEDEFFNSRESGGTVVSTAIDLMEDIIKERYPTEQWNIFGNQISDGDNWGEDNLNVIETMKTSILPKMQYYTYVEVRDPNWGDGVSDLWPSYEKLSDEHPNMVVSLIKDVTEIYPTFRGLFEKRSKAA